VRTNAAHGLRTSFDFKLHAAGQTRDAVDENGIRLLDGYACGWRRKTTPSGRVGRE
jgi:hypothetical protein